MKQLAHEAFYDNRAKEIFGSQAQADDALRAALMTIARHPDIHRYPVACETSRGPLFAFKTIGSEFFPGVVIFYTVDDEHQITLWDVTEHLHDEDQF